MYPRARVTTFLTPHFCHRQNYQAHELFAKSSPDFWVPVAKRLFFWILPHFLVAIFFLKKMSVKAHTVVEHYLSFWPFVIVVLCVLGALLHPAQSLIRRHAMRNPSFVVLAFCVLVPGLLFFVSANRCAKTALDIVHAIQTAEHAAQRFQKTLWINNMTKMPIYK